jgi:hypothetical protein
VPKKQEFEAFLYEVVHNFEVFFEYSRSKLKNQKPISVDVLIKAYPMALLSCRSNLAGRKVRLYLLHVKGTVRPDWICMRVVSLESPLKAHQRL